MLYSQSVADDDIERTVGGEISFNVAVLFDCDVVASFPAASYMPLSTGLTVNTSVPSTSPDKLIPKV